MRLPSSVIGACLIFVAASASPATAQNQDIVDTAVQSGSFQTLTAAVKAAGLVDALKGEGPLTVFAPTDDAFAELPDGTVESLLKPENKAKLAAILKYHVVKGAVKAADVSKLTGAQTLNGQRVNVSTKGKEVMIDSAKVVKADIACSNGVIHVIDRVILPEDKNLVEVAKQAEAFSTLLAAAQAAGLAGTLTQDGPFTVFAPTDQAFSHLPSGTVESLLKPENKDKLASILKYHVVKGRVYSDAAIKAGHAQTLAGSSVSITSGGGKVMVGKAKVLTPDLDASNGVIHVIDAVLLPPSN